jgi:transcriptional regulator with XRE-family HTH domain
MSQSLYVPIGRRLAAERHRLGLRQTELARAVGFSSSRQSELERGRARPSIDYLARVASAGADLAFILLGEAGVLLDQGDIPGMLDDLAQREAARRGPDFTVHGRRGGLKGGPARAKALSPERRCEIARMGAAAARSRPRQD